MDTTSETRVESLCDNLRSSALICGFCLLLVSAGFGQDPWAVPGAPIRFKAEIETQPTSPDAGYIAIIPNGGALPGPFPNAVVIDAAGKQLHSECIWNNPAEGYAIVYATPGSPGPVWIYLEGASGPANAGTPDSILHPSLLLYTRTGRRSLNEAGSLAGENPPGAGSRVGEVPMIADGPNRFGPSDNFVSYYTGWIDVPEAGDVFIGTISSDGSTVVIDGHSRAEWPGLHSFKDGRAGDKGNTITLTKGPHRIQYFAFSTEGTPRAQLIWRLPSMDQSALPVTPREADFIHSGSVLIATAESRAGPPPAVFNRRALSYMNFGDQFVDLFELSAPALAHARGIALDWHFSDGSHARGARVLWPVVRGKPLSVTLTVSGDHGATSGTRLLYPDTLPRGAKVDDASARHNYAEALLNSLAGAPDAANPAAGWPAGFWEMLPQVVNGGEAGDLLGFLFQHCSAELANLSADDRKRLGDIYYDELKTDKSTALASLNKILAGEKDPAAQFDWQLKAVDFEIFEAGDLVAARQIANSLRIDPFHSGKNDAERKLIAQGDVERMAGNLDATTRCYTAAQAATQRAARPAFAAFNGFADPMAPSRATPTPKDGIVITSAANQDADWRRRTVLQNSWYTEVKNLLDQERLDDAREKLDAWALEFPLAKLSGDYTVAESEYAIKFRDFARAQRILKAYRIRIDLSAELAEVMQLEWQCAAALQNPAEIKDLAADIKKRFPDLPLAKEADKALAGEMPSPQQP